MVESRGSADGSSRGPTLTDDSTGLLLPAIPKPPDPPLSRRTPEQQEEQDHHGTFEH